MAAVFSAYDERLQRQVALKILDPAMAQDEVFRQRFLAESRAAAAVEDPHIIPVYEAGEADGVLFIAMRLVPGGDLRSLVARRGPLTPVRAEWILSAVASALDAAHACGLVHRDVKPANMLLDVRPGRPDHVYLSDFGVSKASMSPTGLTSNGQFIGTVDYASPEQILGQPVDGRTDQYALGCAAFELLCGHPPYSSAQWPAAMYSHLSAPPPAATSERPELPAAVDSVFARVLAKSPADRFASCQEFAGALRIALGLKTYVSEEPGAPEQAHAQLAGAGDDTLDPDAANRFAFRVRGPAAAGTDPRTTSQLTVGGTAAPPVRRPRTVLLSGALAGIVIAGGVAAIFADRPHTHAPVASYRFAAQSFPGGLGIRQLWTLAGSRGSLLDVTMTVSNTSGKAVSAQLEEPIPVEVARDPGSVTFSSAVPLLTSPLVVWDLRLPAHGHDEVSYQAPEAAGGVSDQRLMTYVQAYRALSAQQTLELIARPGLVTRVWISPVKLSLNVGQARQLTVHGRLYNGQLASLADLAGVVWTTSNPAVLSVNRSGRVFGASPGEVLVSAQIGGIRAQAVAVVSRRGGAASPPAYFSQPPAQSSPSPSPTSSGSPTPTATPSISGSSSPPSSPPTSVSPTPGTPPASRMPAGRAPPDFGPGGNALPEYNNSGHGDVPG
jgi:serine/threonine-protein kinase